MRCNFESTKDYGGGFTRRKCLAEAEVDGLCWHCAYKKTKAENERLEKIITAIEDWAVVAFDDVLVGFIRTLKENKE